MTKCPWALTDPLSERYHDEQWGVPVHDDNLLLEMLLLEGAQAGLSWVTILKKRSAYRELFDYFDAHKIAHYDQDKFAQLMQNPAIIRNRLKIQAMILNAQAFLDVQQEFGSFDRFIWQFVNYQTIQNHWKTSTEVPTSSAESKAMSKALLKRGFKFVGPTICYAYMQAVGMVNDHLVQCHRHEALSKLKRVLFDKF